MALTFEDKKAIIVGLKEVICNSVFAVVADYRGLTVPEMTELRVNARGAGVKLRVYRNTLARRAIEGTDFSCLKEVLVGPVILLFSIEEPGAAARVLRDFVKVHNALEVRAFVMNGTLIAATELDAIASLPSREEALNKLASMINAPIRKFVYTVKEPLAKLVRAITAVREQKQAA